MWASGLSPSRSTSARHVRASRDAQAEFLSPYSSEAREPRDPRLSEQDCGIGLPGDPRAGVHPSEILGRFLKRPATPSPS